MKNLSTLFLLLLFSVSNLLAQPVSLFEEYHGHITFEWFGQSNNLKDNSSSGFSCSNDNSSTSSTNILIPNGAVVKKAMLYWSGSGSDDFNVTLSGPSFSNLSITAEKEFQETFALKNFFAGAYDITSTVSAAGSGLYTLSDLDASTNFSHCIFKTIYSGWSILIVYEESSLPFSTVRLYDGFEGFRDQSNDYLVDNILIESSTNTKFGILAWESDIFFSPDESIKINNTKISDPFNPANQIFNQTNTNSSSGNNYNMDLDIFDISSQVNVGDVQIPIKLTVGGDLIFLNAFVISYQNKLPDASVIINSASAPCDQNVITLDFEISNTDCNDILPQSTNISFYKDDISGTFLASAKTLSALPIGASETQSIQFVNPGGSYNIIAVVDPMAEVLELDETNNTDTMALTLVQVPVFESISETICQGDSTNWQGQYYSSNILLIDTFMTSTGCDSIVDWTLTVSPLVETHLDTTICAANLPYVLPNGDTANNSGLYTSYLTGSNGCDSTIFTTLNIEQSAWSFTKNICPGDSLFYDGQFFFNDTSFVHTQPSVTGGCDSVITFNLTVKALVIDTVFSVLCTGQSYELPDGTIIDSIGVYTTETNCNQLTISILSKDTTLYDLGLPDTLQGILGESIPLEALPDFNFYNFNWTPITYLDCASCLSTNAMPPTSMSYVLSGQNELGCTIQHSIFISILTPSQEIFIPNAFSPNGDGINDKFLIYGPNNFQINQLEIYDRWGGLLHHQKNLHLTDGWDGYHNGQLINTGVYIYVVEIEFKNGDIQYFSGDISLWH